MSRDGIGPRKAPRQQRSQQTVDRIVEAAARVFNEAGYLGTTTNEIAAEAGVSVGSAARGEAEIKANRIAPSEPKRLTSMVSLSQVASDVFVVDSTEDGGRTDRELRKFCRDLRGRDRAT